MNRYLLLVMAASLVAGCNDQSSAAGRVRLAQTAEQGGDAPVTLVPLVVTLQNGIEYPDPEDEREYELQALNGANAAILGNEIIHFVNVTGPDVDGLYTLDTLIRGRRGTGQWAEAGHARGDRFILLTSATVSIVPTPLTTLNAVRFYRDTTEHYYRIDAELPAGPAYARLTPDGELWVALLEKAFAQFRYGQNSYASP